MKNLNEMPDNNPFKVPENYFEEVNRKIISVTSGYSQEVKKPGLYGRFRSYFAVAASVAGFFILSYAATKLLTHDRINSQLSEVVYLETTEPYLSDIDVFTLEETASSLVLTEEGPDVNITDIIDYLLLDNIEINDIYEQL